MNRPFVRLLAQRAGYSVHQRSSHGAAPAYDWSPKHTMLARHFASEEAAWRDVEDAVHRKMQEAERLIRLASDLIRETSI